MQKFLTESETMRGCILKESCHFIVSHNTDGRIKQHGPELKIVSWRVKNARKRVLNASFKSNDGWLGRGCPRFMFFACQHSRSLPDRGIGHRRTKFRRCIEEGWGYLLHQGQACTGLHAALRRPQLGKGPTQRANAGFGLECAVAVASQWVYARKGCRYPWNIDVSNGRHVEGKIWEKIYKYNTNRARDERSVLLPCKLPVVFSTRSGPQFSRPPREGNFISEIYHFIKFEYTLSAWQIQQQQPPPPQPPCRRRLRRQSLLQGRSRGLSQRIRARARWLAAPSRAWKREEGHRCKR